MNVAAFRSHFPEFADDTIYPDGIVEFWSSIGEQRLNSTRWGGLYSVGVELFTAHNIALQVRDIAGNPGQANVLKSSKSAGDVSVGIDTAATSVEGAGHWNLTTYGTRFKELQRIAGMGGIQL